MRDEIERGITVKKLRRLLEQFDDEMPVHFAWNYGDRARHMVATGVSSAEEQYVKHSTYVQDAVLVDEEDEDYGDEEKQLRVVVLR